MRIGISAIGYECAEHMDEVLAPWLNLKKHQVVLSIAHGIFPETSALGLPAISQDGTMEKLEKLSQKHSISITETPTPEKDLRNMTLPPILGSNVDVVWLLDLQDELYTEKNINDILEFVRVTPECDWFKINFKNYVFNDSTYVDDFVAPRIWRNDRNGGVAGFYYDNEMVFGDGRAQDCCPNVMVPREVAFPMHLSWVGSEAYLKRKIAFQINHYGNCSYAWDKETNQLVFNRDYYRKFNKQIPTLFKDL
jgi:hypothetical protein